MTCHYPDLNGTPDWLSQISHQKHYLDLGSDMSSVWNLCTRSFRGGTSGGVAKCQLFSQAVHFFMPSDNIYFIFDSKDLLTWKDGLTLNQYLPAIRRQLFTFYLY